MATASKQATSAKKDSVEVYMKKLATALEQRYTDTKTIERGGDRIRIPERMSLPEAATVIAELHQRMEEVQQTQHQFDCHPSDGLVCFYRAVSSVFGELMGEGQSDAMKGEKIPGRSVTIPVSVDENVTVPIGDTMVPGLPIKMNVNPISDKSEIGGKLVVTFECKRKYEPVIKEIVEMTRRMLKTDSIYKGKAINSRFEFFDLSGFNPAKVVYSVEEERSIEANILQPIKRTNTWRKAGSSLKRGVLLYGVYGTGKTLTAQLTAYECQRNGWTFINVLPGDDIAPSLKVAKRFAPAVVFFEDIDQATHGERDADLNKILNTVDGVVGKNDEVMVILTTNHVDKINPAMMRPGRLDSAIECGRLDSRAVEKLIRVTAMDVYGSSRLTGDLDMVKVMAASAGYTASFIVESVVKAKAYALAHTADGDNDWHITSEDVVAALTELRPQYNMMRGNVVEAVPTLDLTMKNLVKEVINQNNGQMAAAVVEEARKEE